MFDFNDNLCGRCEYYSVCHHRLTMKEFFINNERNDMHGSSKRTTISISACQNRKERQD